MDDEYEIQCAHCKKEFQYSWALKLDDEIWCSHCGYYVMDELTD